VTSPCATLFQQEQQWCDCFRQQEKTNRAKTSFFARHTLSQMSQAALGLILEAVPTSLFTQLPWFLLPMLSFSDMSACQSCEVWAVKVAYLVVLVVVVTLVLCRTACSVCMRPIGHHRHWLAERHILSATTRPAARYWLEGCQVLHQCYLVLLAYKKN